MKHTGLTMLVVACLSATSSHVLAESWLEDFDDHNLYPDLWLLINAQGSWWSSPSANGGDPRAEWGNGVNATTGVSAASKNYHWKQHSFSWNDPTLASVIVQLDYKTPAFTNEDFPFSGDRLGWTTDASAESGGDAWFQVVLGKSDPWSNPPSGTATIKGDWENTSGSGGSGSKLVLQYAGSLINELSFYRFKAEFTKLTSTSAKIDVSLTAVNADGTLGAVVASGSLADTSQLPTTERPNPILFTASTMWPTFRNYNGKAKGQSDNAYFEIVRIQAPDCYSAVTPDENTINYAEADIDLPSTPNSFEYQVQNLGLNPFTYTVTELDDQQQPADVAWLSTDKAGATVAAQASDTLTANINTAGMTQGSYTAFLKFTDDCNPAVSHIRQINLAVYGCRWTVDSCNQERSYALDYPNTLPQDFIYRLTNTGNYPLTYSVAKLSDAENTCFEWLTVTNPTGTVAVGQYVDVIGHIDVNALVGHTTDNDYNCILSFTDDCSPQVVTRQVRLRYLGVGDDQIFEYNGDMDPELNDSAGPGRKFQLYENVPNGFVEDDAGAIDGKAWRMIDQFGSIKTRYRAYFWDGSSWDNMSLHAEGGSTMVARLKVNSWSGTERRGWIDIEDSDTSSGTFHWGGTDGVASETKRGILEQTGLGTADFVTLWIKTNGDQATAEWQCGRSVDLYMLNDQQQIIWQKHITSASAASSSRAGFFFGDDTTAVKMDVSYDWITGTNAGAFAPGEEVAVLGRSLIVSDAACIIPFPDADADKDVDMADFAVFQRCYSPLTEVSEDCRCFDRDHSGNIDEDDLTGFLACAGGAGVLFDELNPPANCNP